MLNIFGRFISLLQDQNMTEVQIQTQKEEQRQHDIQSQASKQMLYEVFQNTIGILEEFENREQLECGNDAPIYRSIVQIPDQSHKTNEDVQAILQTQILILETQMKTCDKSIRHEASEELRESTLKWVALRQKNRIPMSSTDRFAGQIFQVVSKQETKHPLEFYQAPETVQNVSFDDMEQVLIQQFRVPAIKDEFSDGKKKAIVPDTREEDRNLGIERFKQDPKLISILPNPDVSRWGDITDNDLQDSTERSCSSQGTEVTSTIIGMQTNDMQVNVEKKSNSEHNNECDKKDGQNDITRNNLFPENEGTSYDNAGMQKNEERNSNTNAPEFFHSTKHKENIHQGEGMMVSSEEGTLLPDDDREVEARLNESTLLPTVVKGEVGDCRRDNNDAILAADVMSNNTSLSKTNDVQDVRKADQHTVQSEKDHPSSDDGKESKDLNTVSSEVNTTSTINIEESDNKSLPTSDVQDVRKANQHTVKSEKDHPSSEYGKESKDLNTVSSEVNTTSTVNIEELDNKSLPTSDVQESIEGDQKTGQQREDHPVPEIVETCIKRSNETPLLTTDVRDVSTGNQKTVLSIKDNLVTKTNEEYEDMANEKTPLIKDVQAKKAQQPDETFANMSNSDRNSSICDDDGNDKALEEDDPQSNDDSIRSIGSLICCRTRKDQTKKIHPTKILQENV